MLFLQLFFVDMHFHVIFLNQTAGWILQSVTPFQFRKAENESVITANDHTKI